MIKENIARIKESIHDASGVTIVAVTKGRTAGQVREAVAAGIFDIGENRVQEALAKYKELSTTDYRPSTIKWHMVGHLQTNKVKEAVRTFDLIHSVDSLRLAEEIDKQAARLKKIQDILIEVKTSPEVTKFGMDPRNAPVIIGGGVAQLKNIRVLGLMTVAPLVDNPEKARQYFRLLRELKDRLNELQVTSYGLRVLSMGMTDDFRVAIEEGATMVRLGRAIFGD